MTAGRLAVVGLGPGALDWRTAEAEIRLTAATDLVGYGPYLDLVGAPVTSHQVHHRFDNREEAKRAAWALDLAATGRDVVVVSSGDPGIFAMATAVIEELDGDRSAGRWADVEVTVVPGLTAAAGAAARIGAPLGHDFCVISLSDVLKPWEIIERRVAAVAAADFVVALYNPISSQRPWQLPRAMAVIAGHRTPETPVVVARQVGRDGEAITVTTVADLDPAHVDMRTVLIVGSSTTREFSDAHGRQWVYTPRRYPDW